MAMDGVTAILRNLIGQKNIDDVMQTFEVIKTGVLTLNAGINSIMLAQREMERRADIRHKEILSLFAQLGVRPKSDTAAEIEHRITQ